MVLLRNYTILTESGTAMYAETFRENLILVCKQIQ